MTGPVPESEIVLYQTEDGAARIDVAELGRLVVAPDRQGNGIGTRLALHAERVFPEVMEIRLFTGEQSLANIRLYCRLGYRESGRTPADGYDLVHFAKTLGQPGGVGARVGELAG
ncbi:MAG: GNAT family N-acetyltransferase [Bifidobacteriaceae bacterium]|nr:GNAT family N-acetyltransferase [Bifidobacteriaceae bacterium]